MIDTNKILKSSKKTILELILIIPIVLSLLTTLSLLLLIAFYEKIISETTF